MSFEIRDLMVKLSPVDNQDDDYGQQLPCDECQTTSKLPPGCQLGSLCQDTQCPDPASVVPGEDEKICDEPAPGYEVDPPEKKAGPGPEVALALLRRQLQQTLSQAV